ncbi:hypothetical protein BM221_004925 [Beauveria bassiana]|uniref:Uncharacterized protein n=1 Tax=Beauveria bassiana TaxID=176275 RepID=A0A2N6NM57_BEABA|nr:hypothetical protein BM221_004925 [Beauveria bassiana]
MPKPNTRFLRNIIRGTDTHNKALLAKEAAESKARLKRFERAEETKRKKLNPTTKDLRERHMGDIQAILGGGKRRGRDGGADTDNNKKETDRRDRAKAKQMVINEGHMRVAPLRIMETRAPSTMAANNTAGGVPNTRTVRPMMNLNLASTRAQEMVDPGLLEVTVNSKEQEAEMQTADATGIARYPGIDRPCPLKISLRYEIQKMRRLDRSCHPKSVGAVLLAYRQE